RDASFGVRDQLALPLLELVELVADHALRPLEILRPRAEATLHLLLCVRERFRERRVGRALLLGGRATPLLGDASLLLDQERCRVGTGARERAFELRPSLRRFLLDQVSPSVLGRGELAVHATR